MNNLEIVAICPEEVAKRTFKRVDAGTSLLGTYQCRGCKRIYDEGQLYDGDYADLIRKRLREKRGREEIVKSSRIATH